VLSWTYVYLSRHPSALATLRKEIDDVFGPTSDSTEVGRQILANPKILNRLEYTLALLREILRLEPPAQMLRKTTQPYTVTTRTGASFTIDADTVLFINTYQMARNKLVWGEDAEEFKPERFMDNSIPIAFMTFSKRPRDCIGTNLAYLEVVSGGIVDSDEDYSCFDGEEV
jgi:cytochrome P450